jgi:hypothetical protein
VWSAKLLLEIEMKILSSKSAIAGGGGGSKFQMVLYSTTPYDMTFLFL